VIPTSSVFRHDYSSSSWCYYEMCLCYFSQTCNYWIFQPSSLFTRYGSAIGFLNPGISQTSFELHVFMRCKGSLQANLEVSARITWTHDCITAS
jgi:hypothetical protein